MKAATKEMTTSTVPMLWWARSGERSFIMGTTQTLKKPDAEK